MLTTIWRAGFLKRKVPAWFAPLSEPETVKRNSANPLSRSTPGSGVLREELWPLKIEDVSKWSYRYLLIISRQCPTQGSPDTPLFP